jgi:hypothetical protein
LTSTTTDAPVSCIVTRTRLPSGRVALAAVIAFSLKIVPLLVRCPFRHPPYQVATPTSEAPVAALAATGAAVTSANASNPGSSRLVDMGGYRSSIAVLRGHERIVRAHAPKINP